MPPTLEKAKVEKIEKAWEEKQKQLEESIQKNVEAFIKDLENKDAIQGMISFYEQQKANAEQKIEELRAKADERALDPLYIRDMLILANAKAGWKGQSNLSVPGGFFERSIIDNTLPETGKPDQSLPSSGRPSNELPSSGKPDNTLPSPKPEPKK